MNSLVHRLLSRFQTGPGWFNSLANPFIGLQQVQGVPEPVVVAMYPVVRFEFLSAYKRRKNAERLISHAQRHSPDSYPTIARWRYSRKFDTLKDIKMTTYEESGPEKIESARALYEYSSAELDTLKLDQHQTSVLGGMKDTPQRKSQLLVVDPMWLLFFPLGSEKACAQLSWMSY